MKKSIALYITMVMGINLLMAQNADPVFFREKSFDFANIAEDGGTVMHEFQFTNLSGRPIKILSVVPSCGCTTSGWTKEIIENGKTGAIKANFDPKGRPGYFSKTLTVNTDFDGAPIVLQIKGNVTSGQSENVNDWPAAFGNLRMKSNSMNLGKQFINKTPTPLSFRILNSSNKTIQITGIIAPDYLKVNHPTQLSPGQSYELSVAFNAKLKGQFGFVTESIELQTDDIEMPRKSISVYATVEENFGTLTSEELLAAPILVIDSKSIELGALKRNIEVTGEIRFQNDGKRELLIRAIQSNCSCLTTSSDKLKLKEAEAGVIRFTLRTPNHQGPIQKAITLYSTDPKNSVQRISISGLVN